MKYEQTGTELGKAWQNLGQWKVDSFMEFIEVDQIKVVKMAEMSYVKKCSNRIKE